MNLSWTTARPHGKRAVTLTVLVVATLLALGLVARAELGTSTSTETSPTADQTGAAGTGGGGDDNVAVATNDRDGSTVYSVRLKVVLTGQDTIDSANAAVAVASCTDCTTVAIALEGVLVWGEPETVVPVNLALAYNTECDNCQTLAAAYQYVTSVDSRVRITGDGRRTIAALRQELNTLRNSGLDIFAVQAEVDRIAGEFYQVLKNEVVPIGKPQGDFPTPGATPSAFPEDTTSSATASAATSTDQPSSPETSPSTGATDGTATASPEASSSPETATPSESANATP